MTYKLNTINASDLSNLHIAIGNNHPNRRKTNGFEAAGFDFENVVLELVKCGGDAEITDKQIIEQIQDMNEAFRREFEDSNDESDIEYIESIDAFEAAYSTASKKVREDFHAEVIASVRAAERKAG